LSADRTAVERAPEKLLRAMLRSLVIGQRISGSIEKTCKRQTIGSFDFSQRSSPPRRYALAASGGRRVVIRIADRSVAQPENAHALTTKTLVEMLRVSTGYGLSIEDVDQRRRAFGSNEIAAQRPAEWLTLLPHQKDISAFRLQPRKS
jgi:hypothetical protein